MSDMLALHYNEKYDLWEVYLIRFCGCPAGHACREEVRADKDVNKCIAFIKEFSQKGESKL